MTTNINSLLAKAQVLVIENDPATRVIIERCLAPVLARLIFAEDGDEARRQLQKESVELVLTEITAPGIDGLELTTWIKKQDPDASIIGFSASAASGPLKQAIAAGMEAYLFHPLDPDLLLHAITRSLRDRQRVLDLRLARMVFDYANEGIIVADENTRMIAVNPAFSEITGYRPDEVLGLETNILGSGVHDEHFYRGLWDAINTQGRWSGEISNRRKNGSLYSEWLSIAEVNGDLPSAKRYIALISDISERKKEEEFIRKLAHFDSLTGLANRVLFNDRLLRAIARAQRYHQDMAVLFLDLDYFKSINDTHGHAAGDEVLKTVATRILSTLRQTDTVSRRGGDEFVVILENIQYPEEVRTVCQKLVDEIKKPMPIGSIQVEIGASIGVARFPSDASDPEQILAAADSALYCAKEAGRGQFHFYQAEAQNATRLRLDMARELRAGLKDWRYTLHYLPEISLISGEIENIEALLRFHHPEFGLLEAGRFLEIAEEIGIMPELGQKALAEAASELSSLNETFAELGLVIDLSARQLSAPNAVSHLLSTLVRAGVPTRFITFECPETALTSNEIGMETLNSLASSGCKFTLDDFGTGFCSFSLICQLPMTSIKIDRSFINQIDTDPQIRELVAALISFCKRLGLRAVAEGVETPSQLEFLRQSQCDTVQGYVFGRPMNAVELREFLAAQEWRKLVACY